MQEDAVEEYLSCLVDVQERTLDVPLVKDEFNWMDEDWSNMAHLL